MRFLSSLLAILFGALALLFALNNRSPVTVSLWPLPWNMDMPLFLVGFILGFIGLLAGLCVGVMSGGKKRKENRRLRRELKNRPPASTI